MKELYEKPLPSSEQAETSILGSILLDNSLLEQAIGRLMAEDFYSPFHRRVFAAMLSLHKADKSIDPILIGEELKREGSLESLGGITRITNLTFGLPHFPNLDEYIKVVADKATARNLVRLMSSTTGETLSEEDDIDATIDQLEQQIFKLRRTDENQSFSSVGELGNASIERVKALAKSGETVTLGLRTGLTDLDEMTSGLHKGDLIIVAGRPSMGKTSVVLDFVLNATGYDPSLVVAVFSLEMSKSQLGDKMICQESRVDSTRYRRGHLMRQDFDNLTSGLATLATKQIHIDDSPKLSSMDIKARARKLRKQYGRLDLIVIDHLGLMKGSGRKEKHLELGEISKDLKAMAKDFDAPVIALCQLSRQPETRPDKRPMMSDLRQSGEIEEDADVVMMLFRDEYYKETIDNAGRAELIVGKNRNGPTGTVKLAFQKQWTHFANLHED